MSRDADLVLVEAPPGFTTGIWEQPRTPEPRVDSEWELDAFGDPACPFCNDHGCAYCSSCAYCRELGTWCAACLTEARADDASDDDDGLDDFDLYAEDY